MRPFPPKKERNQHHDRNRRTQTLRHRRHSRHRRPGPARPHDDLRRWTRARPLAAQDRPRKTQGSSRPRHARVRPLDRRHARRGPAPGRRASGERGHRDHAGRRVSRPHAWLPRRRRHLRFAQSLAGQRHQALWRRRLQAARRGGAGHGRGDSLPRRAGRKSPIRICFPPVEDNPAFKADYHPIPHRLRSRPLALESEDRGRLRQRRRGGHRAGAFPPPQPRWARRRHAAQHRARRPQHQRQLRGAASGTRRPRSESARRGYRPDLRRRRRPLHVGRRRRAT